MNALQKPPRRSPNGVVTSKPIPVRLLPEKLTKVAAREQRSMASVCHPLYLDKPGVAALLSLSESTVEKLVRKDEFPKPRMLSDRRVAWLVREVEAWAEARPESNMPPPRNTGGRRGRRQAGSAAANASSLASSTANQ